MLVLWGHAADKLWKAPGHGYPNAVCNCEHFALAGTCEHEQCLRAMLQDSFNLNVEGQSKGGRGRKKGQPFTAKAPAKLKATRGRRRQSARATVLAGRRLWGMKKTGNRANCQS